MTLVFSLEGQEGCKSAAIISNGFDSIWNPKMKGFFLPLFQSYQQRTKMAPSPKLLPSNSTTPTNSPFVARRLRINQSPLTVEEDAQKGPKYRTPPSTPFQPGFYKVPDADADSSSPAFKLPDKKPKTSLDVKKPRKAPSEKKLRRKKRAEKLSQNDDTDSDGQDQDHENAAKK